MPRIPLLLGAGICFLHAATINAQTLPLPRHPTMQQVVGYRMQEQKNWTMKNLPSNSVLYKMNQPLLIPAISRFPSTGLPGIVLPAGILPAMNQDLPSYLMQQGQRFGQWKKQDWWRGPLQAPGNGLLREFILNQRGPGL